jgi:hypothetical protein
MSRNILILTVLLSIQIASAKSDTNDVSKIKVAIVSNAKRNPSSSCVDSNEINGENAMLISDYSKCSPAEIAAIKSVLQLVIDRKAAQFKSMEPAMKIGIYGVIGAARSSLAMIQALGL